MWSINTTYMRRGEEGEERRRRGEGGRERRGRRRERGGRRREEGGERRRREEEGERRQYLHKKNSHVSFIKATKNPTIHPHIHINTQHNAVIPFFMPCTWWHRIIKTS